MLIKLSTWSYIDIRIQEDITVNIDNSSFEIVEDYRYLGINKIIEIIFKKKLRSN
jgi:hypothetical protein